MVYIMFFSKLRFTLVGLARAFENSDRLTDVELRVRRGRRRAEIELSEPISSRLILEFQCVEGLRTQRNFVCVRSALVKSTDMHSSRTL